MNPVAPVTVVIPHFNTPIALGRAVQSVLAQTLLPAQVVVVDDGSAAHHYEDAKAVVEAAQIAVRSEIVRAPENRGPGGARNLGWMVADQPLLAFLDADDTWHPDKLFIQHAAMHEGPGWDALGHVVELHSDKSPLPPTNTKHQPNPVRRQDAILRNPLTTSSVMLRTALPHRFSDHGRFSEDFELWLRIVLDHYKVGKLDLPLGFRHKRTYGEAGQSARLWRMELGELAAFRALRKDAYVSRAEFLRASSFSVAKHLRRLAIVGTRR